MGYFILEAVLFVAGLAILVVGKMPVSRRRAVRGAAANVVAGILMIPLPLYLVACRQSHVPPLALNAEALDPLRPMTVGFLHFAAMVAAFACVLAATVFALVMAEARPRP
jgi:hypothetical protein